MFLSTGNPTLDKLVGGYGFHRGSNVLIRGEPGTGKTTLALQIAQDVLCKQGFAVIYACVEEESGERVLRICNKITCPIDQKRE